MIKKLKADVLSARKAKDRGLTVVLIPLISECEAIGKKNHREPTDAEVIAVIKSFIKKLDIAIEAYEGNYDMSSDQLTYEKEVYESYLPVQMGDDELKAAIASIGGDSLGFIMKELKTKYDGHYDGKLASQFAREYLGGF